MDFEPIINYTSKLKNWWRGIVYDFGEIKTSPWLFTNPSIYLHSHPIQPEQVLLSGSGITGQGMVLNRE